MNKQLHQIFRGLLGLHGYTTLAGQVESSRVPGAATAQPRQAGPAGPARRDRRDCAPGNGRMAACA